MHITSGRGNYEKSIASNGRVGSPCSSLDVSGDLIVNGNRTGMPEYLLDKTCPSEMFRFREATVQRTVPHAGEMMSNDTSRSPIPIDEETYKNMNRHLPRRMEASSMGQVDKSRSRDVSVEQSNSSARMDRANADISQFTQVQPFIMSPKNLQETLQKQQAAIKAHADYRLLQSKNSHVLKK